MNRKEISKLLLRYFGRLPTIPEVNYYEATGYIKKVQDFTFGEKDRYAPPQEELHQAKNLIDLLVFYWNNRDKIVRKLQVWRAKEARKPKNEQYLRKINPSYRPKKVLYTMEQLDNKRRIATVLNFHANNQDIPIPEEMCGVIAKYK